MMFEVTCGTATIYLNASLVSAVSPTTDSGSKTAIRMSGDDTTYRAKESPEEVADRINAALSHKQILCQPPQ